jgi:hypothetical protein
MKEDLMPDTMRGLAFLGEGQVGLVEWEVPTVPSSC